MLIALLFFLGGGEREIIIVLFAWNVIKFKGLKRQNNGMDVVLWIYTTKLLQEHFIDSATPEKKKRTLSLLSQWKFFQNLV